MGRLKRLSHETAAALLAGAPYWRVTDAIEAWRITKATHWYNQNGSAQAAGAGDWLCNDGRAIWSVKAAVFADTYEALGGGLYRKRFPVRAVRLDADCIVETLEGAAKARAGDWLVQNRSGECWPVQGWIFEERYERVEALRDRWFAGETLDQIAASVGVCPPRVRQLIYRAERRGGPR